ncbi:MAG: hypothetical protein A2622_10675 [Bdellovibrionales bacterium RIFCSPHIGHO2_01_FULL_40_29]|nr:MAG: hypothetical protein A2622_10675 [Bdellovibrionales bacterium RIFCSPHIGHO2_01_FULL_40_29]OFZ34421.1 MAG: hypothetical protein A3D17_00940 [Bdellovibrionales bacterium RIFCSPHIGHO2_02_FULL_40_15]
MKRIIFFDGICPLCNGFVDFVLKKDSKRHFQYASLQSDFAKTNLPEQNLSLDSVVLLENSQIYMKSTAVLRVLFQLGGYWTPLCIIASIIPRPLRDFFYDIIAKNRYRVFGKYETCRLPSSEERSLFLD